MLNKICGLLLVFMLFDCSSIMADDSGKTEPKMKIAVFDFTTVDIQAQQFYKYTNKQDTTDTESVITDADRDVIDGRALGFVKAIEAAEVAEQRAFNRRQLREENERNRANQEALANKISKSKERPVVIGAEFMIAALSQYDIFEIVDRKNIDKAFMEMEFGRSGAVDEKTSTQFGNMAGATHMLYATVCDFNKEERQFSGHGVNTNSVTYTLTLLVKLIELSSQKVVFSDEFTGSFKEFKTEYSKYKNSGLFQKMMKDAVKKAAAGLNQRFSKPQKAGEAAPQSFPQIYVSPRDVDPADVEIYVDGIFKGNAPATIDVAPGTHKLLLKASGYEEKSFNIEISSGKQSFTPKMQAKKTN